MAGKLRANSTIDLRNVSLGISLHVEPFNPAKRMYERLGFVVSETRGLYEFMVRAARH